MCCLPGAHTDSRLSKGLNPRTCVACPCLWLLHPTALKPCTGILQCKDTGIEIPGTTKLHWKMGDDTIVWKKNFELAFCTVSTCRPSTRILLLLLLLLLLLALKFFPCRTKTNSLHLTEYIPATDVFEQTHALVYLQRDNHISL